jgi:hypothetical protein
MKKACVVIIILIVSCSRNTKSIEKNNGEEAELIEKNGGIEKVELTVLIDKNEILEYDWLTEYVWWLSDGRDFVDSKAEHIYWHLHQTPYVKFDKFQIPTQTVLYQTRLRNEMFYFQYQTHEEMDKLFPIGVSYDTGVFDIRFRNHYSSLSRSRDGVNFGTRQRNGKQINPDYPLVGIWGELPTLFEYRLVDPKDCIYYFEIDKKIPHFAIREGTYLIKQTEDNVFETISSFSDGELRLEIIDKETILITPLFTLYDDEEGFVAPLLVQRINPSPALGNEECTCCSSLHDFY